MPPPDGGDAGAPLLSERLRHDTAASHRALEVELDLLSDVTPVRLAYVMRRFASFHAGWEPVAAQLLADPALFEPRRRLDALRADLARLGSEPEHQVWPVPLWLRDRAAAWGSLYVMEGSTLGGRVIGRALRDAGLEGLTYFDGRGPAAGPLWRDLRRRLDDLMEPAGRVSAAATATFDALRTWMQLPDMSGAELNK